MAKASKAARKKAKQPSSVKTKRKAEKTPDAPPPPPLRITFKTERVQFPRPYRQGHMDSLCGLYAIVNGCRNACYTGEFKQRISWPMLFSLLIQELAVHDKAVEVLCDGISRRMHDHLIKVAGQYLARNHGLSMDIRRPWRGWRKLSCETAFELVQTHLEAPGTSTLISFETNEYEHWSVINMIDNDQIYFSDSIGMRVRNISEFQFGQGPDLKEGKSYLIGPSSLTLLTLKAVTKDQG